MISDPSLRIGEKLLKTRNVSRYQLRQALALQQQEPERLGTLMTRLGFLPQDRLDQVANAPEAGPETRLGELLQAKGWISAEQLEAALAEQRRSEEELGTLLVRQGWLSPDRLEQALTELLLLRAPTHRRRLGQILTQTRQLSNWQLDLALKLRQALDRNAAHEPLGELLVRLNWLQPQQLGQALRLQKRLLRSMAGVFLGSSLMMGCKAPTVPLQMPYAGSMQIAAVQPMSKAVLSGAFKTLAVEDADDHQIKIRVYQNGSRILENVPYATQGNDNTCGQAVITMAANFWNIGVDYQSLVNTENRFNLATTGKAIVSSLRQKGLTAQDYRDASIDNLLAEINKGRPVITLLDFGSIQTAHYVVIVGYNPTRETLIMHDSLEAAYVEMPKQTFLNMWDNKALRSILPVGGENFRRLMITVAHSDAS